MPDRKDAYWFPHDSNAREDQKLVGLRMRYGWAGVGLWWALVEILRECTGYKYEVDKPWQRQALAAKLPITHGDFTFEEWLQACIEEFDLLDSDGSYIWSPSLLRRMKRWDDKKAALSRAGKKGAAKRWGNDEEPNGEAIATPKEGQCDTNGNYITGHNRRSDHSTEEESSGATTPEATSDTDPEDDGPKFDEDSMAYRAARYLRRKILEVNSRTPTPDENPVDLEKWALSMDRLNRIGPVGSDGPGYNWKEIGAIIDWVMDHEFWSGQIQSAGGLREKIVKVENQMNRTPSDIVADEEEQGKEGGYDPWQQSR